MLSPTYVVFVNIDTSCIVGPYRTRYRMFEPRPVFVANFIGGS